MRDPSSDDALLRALAYVHPIWMVATLTLAGAALRSGLRMRNARRRNARRERGALQRHLRLAKPAVVMALVGFAAGPLSMFWLRGRDPFGTAHAVAGSAALLLFVATGILGRRLERGRGRPLDAHALLATLALLAGAVAAISGFVLLP